MVTGLGRVNVPIPSVFHVSSSIKFSLAPLSKRACSSATNHTVEKANFVYIALTFLMYMVSTSAVLRWAGILGQFKTPRDPEQANDPRNHRDLQSSSS